MKAGKTVLFIVCVLGGLAALCLFFPRDGVRVGGVLFEFPALTEVLRTQDAGVPEDTASAEPVLSPEELMQQRLEGLRQARLQEFETYCTGSPARFYMPEGNTAYFDEFFDALEAAGKRHVRVMHYGDSQLECDRITSVLRERFQETFGGSGVGLLPVVQTVPTYTMLQTARPENLERHLAYGAATMRAGHNRYGVMAQFVHVAGNAGFTFRTYGAKEYAHSQSFTEVKLLCSGAGTASVSVGDSALVLSGGGDDNADGAMEIRTLHLPRAVRSAELSVSGPLDIYGLMLDGRTGVSVDNIPMRGCSGNIFTTISRNTLEPFFRAEHVGLVILQYGGNAAPYLKDDAGIARYVETLKRQIALFRSLSPKSRILFIGPADMATNIDGRMQTYPMLPRVVDAIRKAVNEEGAAFWDMYATMGGRGSMVKWVEARPQLAGNDYIHFTPKGAHKVGDMLYETFQLYYKYYRFRTGKDKVELPADSVAIDTMAAEVAKEGEEKQ